MVSWSYFFSIWHEPEKSVTFQLLEPHRITHVLKVPVLYDLRQADVAVSS